MAIRRTKIDRKVSLTEKNDELRDLPPGWAFTILCPHIGEFHLDFNRYRTNGRESLARELRDAVWRMRHVVVGKSLQSFTLTGLSYFWRFLDHLEENGLAITTLGQIDRTVIIRYLAWLEQQPATRGVHKGSLLSLSTRRNVYNHLKTLLLYCSRNPTDIAAIFPSNPFPRGNRLVQTKSPYSPTEQKRILAAAHKDLSKIHDAQAHDLDHLQVLVVHLIIIGIATGKNLQSLLDIRRDSLQEHPLPDREFLVTVKRRGYSTQATAFSKKAGSRSQSALEAIPSTIAGHIRFLSTYTEPLSRIASQDLRELIMLRRLRHGKVDGEVVRLDANMVGVGARKFSARHSLQDDQGKPLRLQFSRLRPTMATELYRRTRDIRLIQRVLGHSSAETTARHYLTLPAESERNHALILDAMVHQFTRTEIDGKVILAADGSIPLQEMRNLLAGGYNTGIARCRNPFRENDTVCHKYLSCFRCPNMCVFEDDLWRLFSFYYRLLAEHNKINPEQWLKTYGPIIQRIDVDIAPLFNPEIVAQARQKAIESPHPTWRGCLA